MWNDQTMLRHPDVACILGTPDGIVLDANRGLEIKTAGWKSDDWGKPGSDEVPTHYLLQCCQYMAITNLPAWDLAVLFHGNKLEIYTIYRDQDIEHSILNAAQSFWNDYVVPKIPPPVDESAQYGKYLSKCHAIGNQTIIPATPEIEAVALDLKRVQLELKALEASELFNKNTLMAAIGENKGAVLSTGDRVQWVRSKPSEVTDYKALALALKPTPAQVEAFTTEQQRAAYVRLYQGKQ
jgi:predicted phage-related endonuclease